VSPGVAAPPISVRPATAADLETVVALRLALLREECQTPSYGRVRPGAARRARQLYRAQLESPAEVTLLAEQDGVARGILRCAESTGHPLLEPDHYAYVSSVYVVPAARRSGVVRALLRHASTWCRDRDLAEMRLHNAADSAVANAAWEALGFTVVEHLRVRRVPDGARRETRARAGGARTSPSRQMDPAHVATTANVTATARVQHMER
jgi:ribosomal protein S18 acetylase RimI-like enzyme